ncbi:MULTISPECIES: DUF4181 domain-containing protein [Bacillus]|uniref:DUF4181 domain-containing protein n=1 Tax=Bacillus cereus TaxID=1396 RepID=A0A2C1MAY6_BACCE|nr:MULTISPECIES: DUF4181 domain-containing protein [Bacillus]MDH4421713.1 DUF4181 domain-containing protein [Bacillus cereus]PER30134.1 DUF4181 domain-containing protein [Bacillus cereus]PGU07828.1 DUF4181 domain-containing protein [Bacillus cereus]PGX12909.1 DUF4181 domain-containing protein [Bacillus sp. AFS033286]PGZ69242.1 DUF4181 domain-containing protein [Bacillus sp. AFS029637]
MGTSTFWIISIVFCIAVYFFDKFLRKKLNMPKIGFWGYKKHVNSLHKKLEIGLLFIYLITSFIFIFKFESINIAYVIFTYLGGTLILRAWMEWKYARESKDYIFSLIGVFTFVFMTSMLFYFVPPAA